MADSKPNPAQVRGDIDAGLSADKRPGFDPAAAPLETDSEAGGAPLSANQVETARQTQRTDAQPQHPGSYGNAMRPTGDVEEKRSRTGMWLFLLAAAAVGAVAAILLID